MSTIAAGTTSGTALVSTGNTDGTLQLRINGTTPSVTLAANGSIGVGSSPAYGSLGDVLTSAGTGSAPTWTAPSSLAAATQAQMEAASSNTVAVTPLSTNWHPGVAKAWANVNGAGTVINASHNVASITDTGTGVLDVTLTTAFSSASYVILITAKNGAGSPRIMYVSAQLAGSFQASSSNSAGAADDPQSYLIACFGDQS
jgi:hypothetical protein